MAKYKTNPFAELGLSRSLCEAVASAGYTTPTGIQKLAIAHVLAGTDVLGCARTGTGKTAAFALPILSHLSSTWAGHVIRALILAPTRELASQIDASLSVYGRCGGERRLRHTVVYGGVKKGSQIDALSRGIDVLVATPGRLLDLMSCGYIDLSRVDHLVLDEADQMLDMGFIHDVRKIVSRVLPRGRRQTLLFSATMPKAIEELAAELLTEESVFVAADPVSSTCTPTSQAVYFVKHKSEKLPLLVRLLNDDEVAVDRALVCVCIC